MSTSAGPSQIGAVWTSHNIPPAQMGGNQLWFLSVLSRSVLKVGTTFQSPEALGLFRSTQTGVGLGERHIGFETHPTWLVVSSSRAAVKRRKSRWMIGSQVNLLSRFGKLAQYLAVNICAD